MGPEVSNQIRALNEAQIGGKSCSVTPVITTTAGAFQAGDTVGTLLELKDALHRDNGTAILKSIFVRDNANQGAALTILIFNTSPTGMTTTDNSAFAWGSGTGLSSCIAKFNITAANYETIDSKKIASVDTMSTVVFSSNDTANLYAVIITTGTPTYGASSTALSITFSFLQD